MRHALVLCCSVALLGSVSAANAQDWTKSKWGPNDEIGAANYMTPELVVKAASLVKTGKTYALGIPVDPGVLIAMLTLRALAHAVELWQPRIQVR